MTLQDLDRLAELERVVPIAPWSWKDNLTSIGVYAGTSKIGERQQVLLSQSTKDRTRHTHEFIAALRNSAKDLIAAARREARLRAALELLVADVAQYEAWQRPCHALDLACAALAEGDTP